MKTYKEEYTTDEDRDFVDEYEKVVGETSMPREELMQSKRDNKRYNGWANRDTWLVVSSVIFECEYNYAWVKRHAHTLLSMHKKLFIKTLASNLHITQSINWQKVNMSELKTELIGKINSVNFGGYFPQS